MDRVQHCNFILRNLLEVEENISYLKLRGLVNPDDKVHIPDGVHLHGVTGLISPGPTELPGVLPDF